MKILILAHRVCWPLKDGGAICMYNTIKGLHEQGWDITHLAINPRKFSLDMTEAAAELSRFGKFRWMDADTDVKILPALKNLFSRKSYNIERFRIPAFSELIEKSVKEDGPFDIIHFESSFVSLYLDQLQDYPAPKISHQHNVEYEIWQRLAKGARFPLKRWYLKLLAHRLKKFEKQYLRRFDALLAITPDDMKAFRKLGVTKPVYYYPAGLRIEDYQRPAVATEPRSIGHLAFMEWKPNQEALYWFLQEVWPLVQERMPEAKFHAGGKGMPLTFLHPDDGHLHIEGEIEDAAAFMKSKSLIVVPLHSGSGIRIKILEAMAAGTPVVTTTIGLQGIPAHDGEEIMKADEPSLFADKVVLLLKDENLRKTMTDKAKAFVRREYDLKSLSEKLDVFYRGLLAKNGSTK